MAPTNQTSVTVPCETPTCPNYLVVQQDDYIPDPFYCPQCEDRIRAAYIEQVERSRQEQERTDADAR